MIKINRLYSEPQVFTPINFDYGVNIILGEEAESTNKKIGVGKSICIEFINFCLLKRMTDSRLKLIPRQFTEILDSQIKLDLDFDGKKITIARSISNQEEVTIFMNGNKTSFDRVDAASEYLGNLYFGRFPASHARLGFRHLLHPIIRDERSEFKDLVQCHDTKKRIPPDFAPHLFYLNLDVEKYNEVRRANEELKKKKEYFAEIKNEVTRNNELKIQDAKAHLNELEGEVLKLNMSIEGLKNNESFELLQGDLVTLENRLSELRTRQQAIKFEIKQIDSLPAPENINENDIAIIFNQFKQGLGDIVEKSLADLRALKDRIDGFRNTIVNDRLVALKSELRDLNGLLRKLDNEYAQKVSLIDKGDVLRDLKTSIRVFNDRNSELSSLRLLLERYDSSEREIKSLDTEKIRLTADLDENLYQNAELIHSFEESILWIHEKVMGNREAHFEIKTTKNKNVVEFVMRIGDDGSHTTERMKVFIYDVSLMLNEYTKKFHPGLLIHDNIFEDDDSLEKSLNFLYGYNISSPNEFQYIVALNKDLIELAARKGNLNFDIDDVKKAAFTKEQRFLGIKYNETK